MAESTIADYVKKGAKVEVLHYNGGFPLDFLRAGERVQAGPEGTGAEVVDHRDPEAPRSVALVPLGWYLIRWPDGSLQIADAPTFAEDFEAVA
jgi:hypothetical protein